MSYGLGVMRRRDGAASECEPLDPVDPGLAALRPWGDRGRSPFRILFVYLAALALGAFPLQAGPAIADEFAGEGLCRFRLHDYVLPPRIEAAINREVGKILTQHEGTFGFKAAPDFHVRVRIFGQFADYERFTRTNQDVQMIASPGQSLTNLSGYYSHRTREVVTWRQGQPGYLANNLLHEASHAILLGYFRRVPIWLSEGCATYFSFPSHMQDRHDVGSLKYRWAKLVLWERNRQLPALTNFLDLTDAEWRRLDPALAYSVGWSLFQHLMSSEAQKHFLQALVRELQSRPPPAPSCSDLVGRLYPGGIASLERSWHAWIRRGGARVLGPQLEEILKSVSSETGK